MEWFLLFFFPLFCTAQMTLLSQTDLLSEKYNGEVAKAPPPSFSPQTERCLDAASVWFSIDLEHLAVPSGKTALEALCTEELLAMLREIGVEGIYLEHLREGIAIAPRWGSDWASFATAAKKNGLSLIGDGIGNSTNLGPDFELALKNAGEYPSLYHLIEIERADWKLLPGLVPGEKVGNVPWLTLQELHKKGYVPKDYSPYTKESSWNATAEVCGTDGKGRRWIYLKEGRANPVLAWLSPSFGANRIAAADALYAVYQLGENVLTIHEKIPPYAKKTNALWIRKLSAFSAEKIEGGLRELKQASGDVSFDILTRAALLHALVAEDAEALRLIYKLFQHEGIPIRRLIHSLQPFDEFVCDWKVLLAHPKKKYTYWEEQVTAEALRRRLLKEDLYRLGEKERIPLSTWVGYCAAALGLKEAQKDREEIQKAHLLLALTYAMQPGIFSFSAADLLGALPSQATSLDLAGSNPTTLYPSLPNQLRNNSSFASQLKKILEARKTWKIANAELIEVPNVRNRGVLLLAQQLEKSGLILVSAINFSRTCAQEEIELSAIRDSNAIELISGLTEKKIFESAQFSFSLSPLSGKVFLFQKKYYH